MPDEPKPTDGANDESRKQAQKHPSGQEGEVDSTEVPLPEPSTRDQVAATAEPEEPTQLEEGTKFLVAGIGASAGGLEALGELIKHIPAEGVAYIVVQHLAPEHESALPHLLGRATKIPVVTAADGMTLDSGRMYVIPPNSDLAVMHGVLRVISPPSPYTPRLPIDYLFRSLAADAGGAAIGVVLSGTGTDGTLGLKAIKAAGGFAFVQDPATAKYDGMPRSAVQSGAADYCLGLEAIGQELTRITKQSRPRPVTQPAVLPTHGQEQMAKLFVLIRAAFGNDLSCYKATTIDRRLERRMTLNKIEHLDEYVKYVQSNHDELTALLQRPAHHGHQLLPGPRGVRGAREHGLPADTRAQGSQPAHSRVGTSLCDGRRGLLLRRILRDGEMCLQLKGTLRRTRAVHPSIFTSRNTRKGLSSRARSPVGDIRRDQ